MFKSFAGKKSQSNPCWLIGIILLVFVAIAPTIAWQDFREIMERFDVATAMETVRDGHWLLPTLNAHVRRDKPPLTEWITAMGLMSAPKNPEWGARWPSLVMACLTLACVYDFGRTIAGARVALFSAMVFGSSVIFVTYARRAGYDVQLTFWVALAMAALARVMFEGRWLSGCCVAGAALGLAMLTKGPVALAPTVLPFGVFPLFSAYSFGEPRRLRVSGRLILAITMGLLIMVLIALPWPIYANLRHPSLWSNWLSSIQLKEEVHAGHHRDWTNALGLIPVMMPWSLWAFVGIIDLFQRRKQAATRRRWLLLWIIFLPLLVMGIIAPVRLRYLMPLTVPIAVLCGCGLNAYMEADFSRDRPARVLGYVHWLTLVVMVLLLGLGCTLWLHRLDGQPALSWPEASVVVTAAACVIAACWKNRSRWRQSLVLAGFLTMLILQVGWYWGDRFTADSTSSIKPIARKLNHQFPSARVEEFTDRQVTVPLEFSIYLNKTVYPVSDAADLRPRNFRQIIAVSTAKAWKPPVARVVGRIRDEAREWILYLVPRSAEH